MRVMIYSVLVLFILMVSIEAYSKTGSRIKIDTTSWDFGEVKEGQIAKKVFWVENMGDEDLVIEKVYTSCGCTEASVSSNQLAPQQRTALEVTYNSKGKEEGEDGQDIYVISNDPLSPRVQISIIAHIVNLDKEGF